LHRVFPENKIIFLNVSVDTDLEAWKRKIVKEKDWLGTHIILDQQEADRLDRNYKDVGVPKFFLIDQMGKIVSVRASPPSSKSIKQEITSLLTSN
jgi:hypothetical protein